MEPPLTPARYIRSSLFCLALFSSMAVAAADPAGRLAALRSESSEPVLLRLEGEPARVRMVAGRFPAEPGGPGDAETRARGFLARHADPLGIPAAAGGLGLLRVTQDRGGQVVVFQQIHRGLPVMDAQVVVGLDPFLAVRFVRNGHEGELSIDTSPAIAEQRAVAAAEAFLGVSLAQTPPATRLVIAAGDKDHPGFHLAWEVSVFLRRPLGDWRLFVGAGERDGGAIVKAVDMLKSAASACASCDPVADPQCGRVFHQNPVDAAGNPSLRDMNNVDAYQQGCHLSNLISSTRLTGLYANTSITSSRIAPPYSALRSQSQASVDEVTTYYHLDRAKRYLDTLGFPGVMAFSINADAHDPSLGDNSHYVPSGDYLEFGVGGVDDAQDPDIVYHEHGHAIQDNQVPGYGIGEEAGATGEGFGDYWAAALTDDSAAPQLGAGCVGSWDAVSYNPYTGSSGTGCLRRVDGPRLYPRDFVWEVHDDGEIWSSALWTLRGALGGPAADALVIKSHTFLTPGATFLDAADAVVAADTALNGGANAAAIHAAFATRGIPRSATPASPAGLTMTAPFACETAHPYAADGYLDCRVTQPGATRLRLHFPAFDTEAGYDFVRISDAQYREVEVLSGTPFGAGGGYSAAVEGDTIVARFKADPAVQEFGFTIDHVQYAAGAGRIPDGSDPMTDPGLTVEHAAGGEITLSWGASCASSDDDYAIYEGTMGDWAGHVPLSCTNGGLRTRTFTPSAGDTYYLVVPRNAAVEGSYGILSDGSERPASASACLPREVAAVCQ